MAKKTTVSKKMAKLDDKALDKVQGGGNNIKAGSCAAGKSALWGICFSVSDKSFR